MKLFLVNVSESNLAPSLSEIADRVITVGDSLSLTVDATDSNLPDDTLTFEIVSGPEGLAIDLDSGEISWSPSESQGIGVYDVEVKVTDSMNNSDQASFRITIQAVSLVTVSAELAEDTAPGGTTNNDSITSNPTIRGASSSNLEATNIVGLRASFSNGDFVDVSDALAADGSFELAVETLGILNGGALSDGAFRLSLIASDSEGAESNPTFVDFILDTTPPPLEARLAEDSDTGDLGDDTTEFDSVTIVGASEADAAVAFRNRSTVEFTNSFWGC